MTGQLGASLLLLGVFNVEVKFFGSGIWEMPQGDRAEQKLEALRRRGSEAGETHPAPSSVACEFIPADNEWVVDSTVMR